jgi:hypothetical protein
MGEMTNAYRILIRKEARRRPMHRWKDNIRMDIRAVRWEGGPL